jgi:hypothetical protein
MRLVADDETVAHGYLKHDKPLSASDMMKVARSMVRDADPNRELMTEVECPCGCDAVRIECYPMAARLDVFCFGCGTILTAFKLARE